MKKFLSLLLAGSILAACSAQGGTDKDSAEKTDKKEETKVQKIVIGTGTQFPNVCFIDDKGELTGYDVELAKKIDEKLPDYEFEFKTMEFSNLLLSLETKKIDLIAHELEVNKERQEKFLFTKEPYNVFPLKVTVNQKNQDIKTIDDLAGKKVVVSATSNGAVFFEKYNKEHNLGADIVYSSGDDINQLRTGRVDATISTKFAVDLVNKLADAQQKVVGDTLVNSNVYFLVRKGDAKLADRVDEALVELKKEGVVADLTAKWLGEEYRYKN